VWKLVLSQFIVKTLVETLFTPVTYAVVGFLKRAEGEDYYDRDTNFTPFKL
jgi:queuosine precursor transporter